LVTTVSFRATLAVSVFALGNPSDRGTPPIVRRSMRSYLVRVLPYAAGFAGCFVREFHDNGLSRKTDGRSAMKRIIIGAAVLSAVAGTALAFGDGERRFSEFLTGLKEAPQIVLTSGTGTFKATIAKDGSSIEYELTFQNLESDARQAHIHLGYPQNAGNIVLWLCDSDGPGLPASPFAATPLCSQNSEPGDVKNGRVEGTLTAADLVVQAANGITSQADFSDVVRLIRNGRSYVNVHTANIGAGEIRSQINHSHDH
jgi:hypothetical protein